MFRLVRGLVRLRFLVRGFGLCYFFGRFFVGDWFTRNFV